MFRKKLIYSLIIAACVGLPLSVEWITTPPPAERNIHIETFRYGTSPSIIRANRGDRLLFTFSTRDTGHSFFLQDYRIDAKISPANEIVEIRDPLRPTKPPTDAREVEIVAGLSGLWGRLVSVSRFRDHVYCGPMHGFEQGDLIVRPNWLLTGGTGLLAAIFVIGCLRARWEDADAPNDRLPPLDLNKRSPMLDKVLKWRPLQFTSTLPVLAGFFLVVLAGLLGTKVGGRNLATMLTWVLWMSLLTLFLVPVGGRIWCLICPLPVLGEYLQRCATTEVRAAKSGRLGNRFFGLGKRWPKPLSGPWMRVLLFLVLGTFSASLVVQPHWTAMMILAMAGLAVVMSLLWELRAFCRYICPVASFISSFSVSGRLMVRRRDDVVCRKCRDKACLKGNAKGWACPYGLSVATMNRNVDCGVCTECFKSCPYNNVSLAWRRGRWTDSFKSYGEAWQAIVLMVFAMVYALTIHSPWPFVRDMVNIIDNPTRLGFGIYAFIVWTLALGVVPLLLWLATGLGVRWTKTGQMSDRSLSENTRADSVRLFGGSVGDMFKKTMPALIPFSMTLWASFFVVTIMVNWSFVVLTLSDPFGWGWNLFGTAGMPWIQFWPSGIPWIQVGLTITGLTLALRRGYAIWASQVGDSKKALKGFAPTAMVLVGLGWGMLVYFAHY
jgi:hypothetical protein